MKKEEKRDYIFTYVGDWATRKFICSATNGDEAMKKFHKEIGYNDIINIEIMTPYSKD